MQYSPCEKKKKIGIEFFLFTSKNMFNIFKVNLTMDFQR